MNSIPEGPEKAPRSYGRIRCPELAILREPMPAGCAAHSRPYLAIGAARTEEPQALLQGYAIAMIRHTYAQASISMRPQNARSSAEQSDLGAGQP